MADNLAFRAKQKKKAEAAIAAGGTPSQPVGSIGWQQTQATKDPTGGGMSPAFRAKYEQALAEQRGEGIQPQQPTQPTFTKTGSWVTDLKNWWGEQTTPAGETIIKEHGIEDAIHAVVTAGTIAAVAYYGIVALGALGIGTAAKGLAVTAKTAAVYKTTGVATGTMAANPKTTGTILSALWKSGVVKTGLLLYILKEAQQDIVFGKFQLVEGLDKLGIVRSRLIQEGLDKSPIGIEVGQSIDQYTDAMNWYRLNIPILGSKIGTDKNIKAAEISRRAWDAVAKAERLQRETGTTDAEVYAKGRKEQEEMEMRLIDYYNEQKKLADEAAEAARARADEKSALMWDEYAAKQRELEKAEREEIAAFWLEYWRIKLKLQESYTYGRSTLGFGLFR